MAGYQGQGEICPCVIEDVVLRLLPDSDVGHELTYMLKFLVYSPVRPALLSVPQHCEPGLTLF
jgi:hypothetical protein